MRKSSLEMAQAGTYFSLLPPELWQLTLKYYRSDTDIKLRAQIERLQQLRWVRVPEVTMRLIGLTIGLTLVGFMLGRGAFFLAITPPLICCSFFLQGLLDLGLSYYNDELSRLVREPEFQRKLFRPWHYPWSSLSLLLVVTLTGLLIYLFWFQSKQ